MPLVKNKIVRKITSSQLHYIRDVSEVCEVEGYRTTQNGYVNEL